MKPRIWFKEIRGEFLLLSVVLVLLGTAMAWYEGCFNWLKFILTFLGLLLAHISVNVLNEYFDYKSGIDLNTNRTPFSGGSGVLPKELLKPQSVYILGIACLIIAFFIGIYLTILSGWQLFPLIIVGGLIIYFYTSYLTKLPMAELFAGIGLGSLPVLGTYFVQVGSYSFEAVFAAVAPGLLTANLLFLNEFPDYEADKKGGRHHLVIALGKKRASRLYAGLVIMVYLCIIIGMIIKLMPPATLVAIVSIPAAIKAVIVTLKHYDDIPAMIPAQKANIFMVLGTDILLALGYFLGSI